MDSSLKTLKTQLGILSRPGNLLKTVGSQFPGTSAAVEMHNQLEGKKLDDRLTRTEQQVDELTRAAEKIGTQDTVHVQDWSYAAAEYAQRSINFAVLYDGGYHSPQDRGRELVQSIAHGCLIGPHEVLTCKEAVEMVSYVVKEKQGRPVVLLSSYACYEFTLGEPDERSGLTLCHLTTRDEQKWSRLVTARGTDRHGSPVDNVNFQKVRATVMPQLGQEIGFMHVGEATDVSPLLGTALKMQFDTSVISHFRGIRSGGLKVFVSGVLSGRFLHSGSPVFARDATLLGVLADAEHYPSDAGRRAVVRSLLGHPRFTTSAAKS